MKCISKTVCKISATLLCIKVYTPVQKLWHFFLYLIFLFSIFQIFCKYGGSKLKIKVFVSIYFKFQ